MRGVRTGVVAMTHWLCIPLTPETLHLSPVTFHPASTTFAMEGRFCLLAAWRGRWASILASITDGQRIRRCRQAPGGAPFPGPRRLARLANHVELPDVLAIDHQRHFQVPAVVQSPLTGLPQSAVKPSCSRGMLTSKVMRRSMSWLADSVRAPQILCQRIDPGNCTLLSD